MKASARRKKLSTHGAGSRTRSSKIESTAEGELSPSGLAIKSMGSDPFWPPISDPFEEKEILERKGHVAWIEWLQKCIKATAFAYHPRDEEKRIAQVYRLCFEESGHTNVSIIGDFVAHYPRIVLSGTWVGPVAEQWSITGLDETNRTRRNRLLKAISDGFRRAALSSWKGKLRPSRLRAALEFRSRINEELKSFVKELQPQNAQKEWLARQIEEKVSALVRDNPLLSSVADKLTEKLSALHPYDASILIAATIFDIRERDLQAKSA